MRVREYAKTKPWSGTAYLVMEQEIVIDSLLHAPDKPEVAMKKHDLQSGRCSPKIGFKKKKTPKGRAKFESVELAQS
jgi:hypothetical protein